MTTSSRLVARGFPRLAVVALTSTACFGQVEGAPQTGADELGPPVAGPRSRQPSAPQERGACNVDLPRASLRRLTEREYRLTVAALFGTDALPELDLPADARTNGFDNGAGRLVQRLEAAEYAEAAHRLATWARQNSTLLTTCAVTAKGGETCADELIKSFGRRAFRRPLLADESAAYLRLYRSERDASAHLDAMAFVIEAMLSSPHFLYRRELGQPTLGSAVRALDAHELASSLSYLLTRSMPDPELLSAADRGALSPAELEAQARRLLATPAGREGILSFVLQLTNSAAIEASGKDSQEFPFLTPALQRAMRLELERFFMDVFPSDDGFAHLFQSRRTFLNRDLAAKIYGLPTAGLADAELRPVDVTAPGRRGILTLPAVIFSNSQDKETGLIQRGKFIRERVLCDQILPPPPGVDTTLAPAATGTTKRAILAAHSSAPACAGCHRLIDPFGFSLESFDAAGRYRANDRGAVIDTAVSIDATRDLDGRYGNFAEISEKMAGSTQVRACFVQQMHRFGSGGETGDQACALDVLTRQFEGDKLNMRELLVSYVRSDLFRLRRE